MSDSDNLRLRDARDRLVDLLGLGETYPLRDVAVTGAAKVPFAASARILVDPSQAAVRYELRDSSGGGPPGRRDQALERIDGGQAVAVAADGNDGALALLTPAVVEDVTFTILASKRHPLADGGDSLRALLLDRRARIKVGLDTRLPARILVGGAAELLDPQASADADARLIDHGGAVTVAIDGAQEGVDYALVSVDGEGATILRCAGEVRGLGEGRTITIPSTPLVEDLDLRVRATKSFAAADDRDTEVALLDAVLRPRVRADPAIAAAATPVILHGGAAQVTIHGTQASARYQLFGRPIRDRDLVRGPGEDAVRVPVDGDEVVRVARPAWAKIWSTPPEMIAIGEAALGTGGDLILPVGALTQDTLLVVRATKAHRRAGAASPIIESAVQLIAATATLVGPDPAPTIALRVAMRGGLTSGWVEVLGGQPGVAYHLRRSADGDDLGLPAYVHQRDDRDPTANKGIGQLGLEIDLAVAATPEEVAGALAHQRPPASPRIITAPIEVGAILHLHAVKLQTGIAGALAATAEIAAAPTIEAAVASVSVGESATILVRASIVGQRYQLLRGRAALTDPVDGDGGDLELPSGPIAARTTFIVEVSRPLAVGLAVAQQLEIEVEVT